jgi:NAD(P)-dependent dehydrogenase (short-subunit alcohol dehydrogenase family)
MAGRLAGKVFAITGGESGLGRAMALRAAQDGAMIAVGGLDAQGLDETVASMSNFEGNGVAIPTDVTDPAQVQALIDGTVAAFGRLDGAIANAGAFNSWTDFQDWDLADWHRVVNVNLTGTFMTLQAATKVLIEQGEGGSLLATGSSTAIRPIPRVMPYVASKGGVHQMMRALAVELAPHKIRVNTIVPGMARTPPVEETEGYIEAGLKMVPMGEVVEPDEIAALVAFALSDEAPHMTGSLLKVDAGRTSA